MPSIASLYHSLLLPAIHSTASTSNNASSIYYAAASPRPDDHDQVNHSDNKPSFMPINNYIVTSTNCTSTQSQDPLLGQDDHLLLSRQHLLSIVNKNVLDHHIDCVRYDPDGHPLSAFINPAPDSSSQPLSMNINPALEHQYLIKDQPIMSKVICPGRINLYQFERPFLINSTMCDTRIKPQESTSLISSYSSSASPLSKGAVLIRERNTDEKNIISSQLITGNINVDEPANSTTTLGAPSCTPRPRWCPTQEQIRVLESLFNAGTTTPSRDMIVEIASHLKQFGNIVEANVFYWFQNRKARAKRKLSNISNKTNNHLHHGRSKYGNNDYNSTRTINDATVIDEASNNPTILRSLQDTLLTSCHELDMTALRSCKRPRKMLTQCNGSQTDHLQAAHAPAVSLTPLYSFANIQSQSLTNINQPEFNTTSALYATSRSSSPNIDQCVHGQLLPSKSDDFQQSSSCNLMANQLSLQSRNIDGINGVRYDNSSLTAQYSYSIEPTILMSEADELASIFVKRSSAVSSNIYRDCAAFDESDNGPTKVDHHLDHLPHFNAPHLLSIIGTSEAASLHDTSQHINTGASHRQQRSEGNSAKVPIGVSSTTRIETLMSDVESTHHHDHHRHLFTDPDHIDKEDGALQSSSESDIVVSDQIVSSLKSNANVPSLDQYSSCGLPPLWEALAPFIN